VQAITIPILPFDSTNLVPGQLAFKLTISNPLGGVMLGQRKECRVVVVPGNKLSGKTLAERVKEENGEEEFNLWHAWRTRFKDAILPASPDDDDGMWIALFLHYISITFKVIAAFVPPAEYLSGYLSLPVALLLLGGLMFIVKNVSRMLGCVMGLSDLMTGLSIVAVGTSLPDTFGTLYATLHSDTADEGIGNVMGSNCVNIFLGLGIPYVISTSYYMAKKTSYVVSAGALSFSVMVYMSSPLQPSPCFSTCGPRAGSLDRLMQHGRLA
jgi:solute carrier family 8 (sodium/calcium exchanger)